MEQQNLTSGQFFLRYAWPCAGDRMLAGKISKDDFEKLQWCVIDDTDPGIFLLERCFPKAAADLKILAVAGSSELWKVWTLQNVQNYWHNHHGHSDDCAVTQAMVCEVGGKNISVMAGSKTFPVLNLYRIKLEIGDTVYVHKNVAIEKI